MQSYVICSQQRTGSEFLCEMLSIAGLGNPSELLNCNKNDTNVREKIYQLRVICGNKWFGIKTHYHHLTWHDNILQELPTIMGSSCKWICVSRHNILRQACSLSKAFQTNKWHSTDLGTSGTPIFDYDGIIKCMLFLVRERELWEQFFHRHNIQPYRLFYEDMDECYGVTMRNVLDYLSDGNDEIKVPSKRLCKFQKQSDAITDEWVHEMIRRTAHCI